MGVSPVTGRIYYGNLRGDEWIGGKEDVTETAVRAVFEWFVENLKMYARRMVSTHLSSWMKSMRLR